MVARSPTINSCLFLEDVPKVIFFYILYILISFTHRGQTQQRRIKHPATLYIILTPDQNFFPDEGFLAAVPFLRAENALQARLHRGKNNNYNKNMMCDVRRHHAASFDASFPAVMQTEKPSYYNFFVVLASNNVVFARKSLIWLAFLHEIYS